MFCCFDETVHIVWSECNQSRSKRKTNGSVPIMPHASELNGQYIPHNTNKPPPPVSVYDEEDSMGKIGFVGLGRE